MCIDHNGTEQALYQLTYAFYVWITSFEMYRYAYVELYNWQHAHYHRLDDWWLQNKPPSQLYATAEQCFESTARLFLDAQGIVYTNLNPWMLKSCSVFTPCSFNIFHTNSVSLTRLLFKPADMQSVRLVTSHIQSEKLNVLLWWLNVSIIFT